MMYACCHEQCPARPVPRAKSFGLTWIWYWLTSRFWIREVEQSMGWNRQTLQCSTTKFPRLSGTCPMLTSPSPWLWFSIPARVWPRTSKERGRLSLNWSTNLTRKMISLLKEADVEVYAIGMFDRYAMRFEEKRGPLQLDEVTSVTGGRLFPVHDSVELSLAVTEISQELRNQYVLGSYPSNRKRDGKWRKLRIRLTGSASQEKVRLYAKKGYYPPAE